MIDRLMSLDVLKEKAGVPEEVVDVLGFDSADIDSVRLAVFLSDHQLEVVVALIGKVL